MGQTDFYLIASTTGWRAWCVSQSSAGTGDSTTATIDSQDGMDAESVRRLLAESVTKHKSKRCRVVIGLPASWCLPALVSTDGLPRGSAVQREQAMAFRLESLLPITAEDCAIGFVDASADTDRLGIAVEAAPLIALVRSLEDDGHEVEAIVPRAMLAAQAYLVGAESGGLQESVGLLWREPQGVGSSDATQLLLVDPNHPPRWRVLEGHDESLSQQLDLDKEADQSTRRWLISEAVSTSATQVIESIQPSAVHDALLPSEQAELQTARGILERHQKPWINLRCGPLAPRHHWRRLRVPALACTAAAAVVLLTAITLMWFRAEQYNHLAQQHDQGARAAFAEAMPGQTVPTSPQRRLKTRLKQLRGEQGLAAGDEDLVDQAPTLVLLHEVLAGLPADQRFAITDLRLEDGELRLTGHARSHGEADLLANTLRTHSSFIVEPPSTDSLGNNGAALRTSGGGAISGGVSGGGVRFVIQATYRPTVDQKNQQDGPSALAKREREERP